MTLRQMVKLIVLCAVGSACFAPIVHFAEAGVMSWGGAALMGGIAVPISVAVASFIVVRRGPIKDWLIRTLLAISTSVALGIAVYILSFFFRRTSWWTFQRQSSYPLLVAVAALMLGVCLTALARRVVPRRCPGCGWSRSAGSRSRWRSGRTTAARWR